MLKGTSCHGLSVVKGMQVHGVSSMHVVRTYLVANASELMLHLRLFAWYFVSGVSRAKIEEVTLNALRTRQSLVKGERLVRHEVRAVLPTERDCPLGKRQANWVVGCSPPLRIIRCAPLGFLVRSSYPGGYATLSSSAMPEATSGRGPGKPGAPSPHRKIDVKREPPVGGVSVFTLIRTDTTLDHSQKAEKVCGYRASYFWAARARDGM